jgi:hypothetical protein
VDVRELRQHDAAKGRLLVDETDEVMSSAPTGWRPFSSSTVRSATPAAWMSPVIVDVGQVGLVDAAQRALAGVRVAVPWSNSTRRRSA